MTFQKVIKMTEIATSYHYLLHSVYTEHVHQILTSTFKPVVKWLQREQKKRTRLVSTALDTQSTDPSLSLALNIVSICWS